jgi:hypothetical protein
MGYSAIGKKNDKNDKKYIFKIKKYLFWKKEVLQTQRDKKVIEATAI